MLKARWSVLRRPTVLFVATAARLAGTVSRAESAADVLASSCEAAVVRLPSERTLAAVSGVALAALTTAEVFCQPHSSLKSPGVKFFFFFFFFYGE